MSQASKIVDDSRNDSIDCDIIITNVPNIMGIYKRLLEELTCDLDRFGPIELLQPLKENKAGVTMDTTCCFLRYYNRQQHQEVCEFYNKLPAYLEGKRLCFS